MINAIIQYTIVIIILLLAVGWIIYRFFTKKGKSQKGGACCGCALSDSCNSKNRKTENGVCNDKINNVK